MDSAELALIRKTFENALPGMTGDPVPTLTELGWPELHEAAPAVAVGELFEAQGRLAATSAALDVVVADGLGHPLPERTAVVHPSISGSSGEGIVLAGTDRADRLLIPEEGTGGRAGAVLVDKADVQITPVAGFDPALRLVAVSSAALPPAHPAIAAARRALAHELCGVTQSVLDAAVAQVTDRHQFGRPIAAFQTVRHRLTEVFVALASARSALDAAWTTGDPLLDDAAKALAGRAAALAARHCLQVTGAIGFTEEYPLAGRIRRLFVLDALYGSADELESAIGTQLLAEGRLPRPHPLT